ncbi:MAG TPA: hypothetical protein QGF35_07455 [Dehalococcoidia bacterium]|nr:hypothetical protein [Dehalococcoidia bacterium]
MTEDRLDHLLDEALATGDVPSDASPTEREEIERLLQASRTVREAKALVDAGAEASMLVAKARFERFLTQEARSSAGATDASPSRVARVFGLLAGGRSIPKFAAIGGPVAAAVLLIAVVVIVLQGAFDDVDTAIALESGDYVQLQGKIADIEEQGDDLLVRVESPAGVYSASVTQGTALRNFDSEILRSALKRGITVALDGIVSDQGVLVANTVAVGDFSVPDRQSPEPITDARDSIKATIVMVRLSEDGSSGHVVFENDAGRHFIVPVDGRAFEALLHRFSNSLGERIEVRPPSQEGGAFQIDVLKPSDGVEPLPLPRKLPPLIHVRGEVVRVADGFLELRNADGTIVVRLTPSTRILAKGVGLLPQDIVEKDAAVGFTVTVTGRIDPTSDQLIASVVTVGSSMDAPQADRPKR